MDNYLEHHGVLGQRWGIRRYQNSDGSLKPAGKTHYGSGESSNSETKSLRAHGEPRVKQLTDEQKAKVKTALKVGAAAIGVGLATYGAYKFSSKMGSDPVFADSVQRGMDSIRFAKNKAAIVVTNHVRNAPENMAKGLKAGAKKAGEIAKNTAIESGKVAKKTAKDAVKNARNAALDVAITGLTVAAIKNIESSISTDTGDKTTDFRNKVIKTAAKNTVNDAANNARSAFKIVRNSNSNSNNSQPSKSQSEIESIIGSKPKSHNMVDNTSPEWGKLLNSVSSDKKQVIKDARRLGYDWDELHSLAERL